MRLCVLQRAPCRSAIAGQDRAAVSYLVTLSPKGDILKSAIKRTTVRVEHQYTYDEAEELSKTDATLQTLVKLSQALKEKRIQDGALIIPIPDVLFRFEENEVSAIDLMPVDSPMRLLVSEFMVLANMLAAQFLARKQEPGLYRSQPPAQKRLFMHPSDDNFTNFRQRRFLSRGQLNTTPNRHDGVGAEQYTTSTSPIRRLLDLVIQHQICSLLKGNGSIFREKDLNEFSSRILSCQSKVNLVRQRRHRYWLFKFLEQKKNQRLQAFVLDKRNRKVQVVLTDYLFESELPPNRGMNVSLGDIVMVKLAKVSALDNEIKLDW